MMRAHLPCLLLLGACAGSPEPMPDTPNWSGPPLRTQWLADGSLEVVLTAPTASHTLDLRDVAIDGNCAEVHLDYTTPGNAFVAQVVTDVTARVPKARLVAASTVRVWISTKARDASGAAGKPVLAVATRRP